MKNKYVAALLALLAGWIGLHKFYLWKWGQWIIYILFMLTYIPLIISVFEAIIYLFNTKEWFDMNYNIDYMKDKEIFDIIKKNNSFKWSV